MKMHFSDKAKRNISLVIILLLSAVYCGSIDLSCDVFSPGGSIKGSNTAISRSLIASTPLSARDEGRDNGNAQGLEKANSSSDILSWTARKILKLFDDARINETAIRLKSFSITICITGFTYLFLKTHVFFIHLKDGSK